MRPSACLLLGLLCAAAPAVAQPPGGLARVGGGTYVAPYRTASGAESRDAVAPFRLARTPVTNAQYLAFVRAHPEWRRSGVRRAFADAGYLRHWAGDLVLGAEVDPRQPVVYVSWFAARAYARAQGGRLPTVAEWEVAARAGFAHADGSAEPAFQRLMSEAYGRPRPAALPLVGRSRANVWGLHDLHGVVHEWTDDVGSVLGSADSRRSSDADSGAFCAAGGVAAVDARDYPAFLRFGYRAGLDARATAPNLGLRLARDAR